MRTAIDELRRPKIVDAARNNARLMAKPGRWSAEQSSSTKCTRPSEIGCDTLVEVNWSGGETMEAAPSFGVVPDLKDPEW